MSDSRSEQHVLCALWGPVLLMTREFPPPAAERGELGGGRSPGQCPPESAQLVHYHHANPQVDYDSEISEGASANGPSWEAVQAVYRCAQTASA